MKIETIIPGLTVPKNIILPEQIHGTRIVYVQNGREELSDCDGIFTDNPALTLGIRTADCAPIVFWDEQFFGIIHAGWRGLAGGICQKMLKFFRNPQIFIGPLLPVFEITKDCCYMQIKNSLGTRYFSKHQNPNKLNFNFAAAILDILPQALFDNRNTFLDKNLASWRRDHNNFRNITYIKHLT